MARWLGDKMAILQIQFGYLMGVLYLLSGVIQHSRFLKKQYIFFAMAIWLIVNVLRGDFRFLVFPVLFFILSISFLSNFTSSLEAMRSDYKLKVKRINDDISKQSEILAAELRLENDFRSQLESIVSNYIVAKEMLSHLNKLDFCKKISDILLSFEGVRGVAIFDNGTLCSTPESKSDWFRSIFDNFHNTGDVSLTNPDILIFRVGCVGGKESYIFLESETEKHESIKNILKSVIPVISLGLRRVSLFEEYELKSRRDALTGLFNRRYFEVKLENEVGRSRRYKSRFGVLMIDIDFFKKINDTFGHTAGDAVLKKVSQIISDIKHPGAFAGRYGGEEFIVCLPLCDRAKLGLIAESLRKRISEERMDDLEVLKDINIAPITVSIGGAVFPDDGTSIVEVISRSDKLLYEAKQSGRNRVVIS